MMRDLASALRDDGGALATEAADLICELQSDLDHARDEVQTAEDDARALRERVAELEAARLCRPCAMGTFAPDVFCAACGAKR